MVAANPHVIKYFIVCDSNVELLRSGKNVPSVLLFAFPKLISYRHVDQQPYKMNEAGLR